MNDDERKRRREEVWQNDKFRAEVRKRLGQKLKELRTAKGVTVEELSLATGIKIPKLIKYEEGRFLPSTEQLDAIAHQLDSEVTIEPIKQNE